MWKLIYKSFCSDHMRCTPIGFPAPNIHIHTKFMWSFPLKIRRRNINIALPASEKKKEKEKVNKIPFLGALFYYWWFALQRWEINRHANDVCRKKGPEHGLEPILQSIRYSTIKVRGRTNETKGSKSIVLSLLDVYYYYSLGLATTSFFLLFAEGNRRYQGKICVCEYYY